MRTKSRHFLISGNGSNSCNANILIYVYVINDERDYDDNESRL